MINEERYLKMFKYYEFCLFDVFVYYNISGVFFLIKLKTTRNQLYFFPRAFRREKHKQLDDVINTMTM